MVAILGISAFYHDAAAAILVDGKIIAAAQEERFTRLKNDARFPAQAIEYCLKEAGLSLPEVDNIVFYEEPFAKFERLLDTYMAFAPRGLRSFTRAMPIWIKEKLYQRDVLVKEFKAMAPDWEGEDQLTFGEHHLSHCASAFYPSPFEEAIVLSIDGVGERTTTSAAIGRGSNLEIVKEIEFPHSIGLLYSAFTQYLGFRVNFDEYKVMGLAPYGKPRLRDAIFEHMVDVKADGSFWLDQSCFSYAYSFQSINARFCEILGAPARMPDEPISQHHMDVARSIQAVTQDIVTRLAKGLANQYALPNLCLAGGVAQNSVVNGMLASSGMFKNVWVQPSPGDAGGALGAALAYWHLTLGHSRGPAQSADGMQGAALGPGFSQVEIEQRLDTLGAHYETVPDDLLFEQVAQSIDQGDVVGWFDGRMEFGPRALGNRSILADPRSASMQSTINLKVKGREGFRPFAPAVLEERCAEWFEFDHPSPYMGMVAPVAASKLVEVFQADQAKTGFDMLSVNRSQIPAVTHVDGSARLQTVNRSQSPRFHALISAFEQRTGCPILLNTSFNGSDEPIVCTPEEAFNRFIASQIDVLVCGNCIMRHEDNISCAPSG